MLTRAYYIAMFALSWLGFGLAALVVNAGCAVLLPFPGRHRFGPAVRAIVRGFFSLWSSWLRATRLVRIRWHGFDAVPLRGPAVWVANHPGLLDATFLLARLPDAVCVFKPAILRNPFLAPAALLAGYIVCGDGLDFVRRSVREVSAGRTLLIFPEGTRTSVDLPLNPCRNGYALVAARAAAPVQIVVIRASRDLLPRGRRWWQIPHFPATVDWFAEDRIPPAARQPTRAVAGLVEQRLQRKLHGLPCLA